MPDLSELPLTLRPLIERFQGDIDRLMQALLSGQLTAEGWVRNMEEAISLYHLLALAAGQQDTAVSPEAKERADNLIGVQLAFLAGFGAVVGAVKAGNQIDEMAARFRARARSYAHSIYTAWSLGDMIWQTGRIWPVAALPGQGTQCGSRCLCKLRYEVFDKENGDADIYWELEPGAEHCQTCEVRNKLWYPMKIRNGRLMPSPEPNQIR